MSKRTDIMVIVGATAIAIAIGVAHRLDAVGSPPKHQYACPSLFDSYDARAAQYSARGADSDSIDLDSLKWTREHCK